MASIDRRSGGPTIADIALRAGVHQGTVSVVLNGGRSQTRVSEATRQRILKIAEELRYSPNVMARGLMTARFNALGVSFPYPKPTWLISDYYGTSLLEGIIGGASDSGYNVTHFTKPWRDAKHSAAGFRGQGIDGFLVVAPGKESDMVSGLAATGIPLVVISASCDELAVPSVDIDNVKGVRLGLEHLLALGHRRIAHIIDSVTRYDNEMRRIAFLAILAEAGIRVPPEYIQIISSENPWSQSVHDATRALLSLPSPPSAIVMTDDKTAMEAMKAARDLNIAIPEQLSIIGFDDHPEAKLMTPPLTTLRQPLVEMGETAARMLVDLVEGKSIPPRTHLFEPELAVRGSTAPPWN